MSSNTPEQENSHQKPLSNQEIINKLQELENLQPQAPDLTDLVNFQANVCLCLSPNSKPLKPEEPVAPNR